MSDPSEKKVARRRRTILAGAAMLLIVFAGYMTLTPSETWRAVDIVRTSAFLLLAVIVALRSTTAFSLIGRNPVLDDELTRANRASAARVGFWAFLLTAIACFGASLFEAVSATQIIPLLIGVGAMAAALRFAVLEGRGSG
jgi:hypothetical protein